MEIETPNTKTALILAAGPLFAAKGEDGVSVRTIASQAAANVASINYHFGSKENLYIATIRYVLDKLHTVHFYEAWQDLDVELRTREGVRGLVEGCIRNTYTDFFLRENPEWFCSLLYREISAPTAAFTMLKRDIILPNLAVARELFALLKPGHPQWEPEVWMNMWHGQVFFFAHSVNALKDIYLWLEGVPAEYLEQQICSTIRMALVLLDYEV